VVILGPPGGSKKEICSLLSKDIELKHINSGSLVWAEIEEKTPVGKRIESTGFNDVELVDDHIITDLVKNTLKRFDVLVTMDGPKNQLKGWIMDGFPRT